MVRLLSSRVVNSDPFGAEALEARQMLAGEPWGSTARLINLDELAADYPTVTGAGQAVVVIDTGVDYNHPSLGGGWGKTIIAGYDFVDNDTDPMDTDGHGTGVAGVIAASEFVFGNARYRGIAPGAKIIALRTDSADTTQNQVNRNVELALQWVIARLDQYNIASINMSFGRGSHSSPTSLEPYGDELATLKNAGVFIAAASGNEGVSSPPGVDYPGADPNVFSIGSVDTDDTISSFTSRSSLMDLLAPGRNVPVPYFDPAKGQHIYLSGTGTSFATPAAAGAAALLRQVNPNLTPDQILSVLKSTGSQNFDGDRETGRTTGLSYARLDLEQAVASLRTVPEDDRFEENDSIGAAPTVLTLGTGGGSGSVGDLRMIPGDVDYFRISLGTGLRTTFHFSVQSGSAIDVDLYNSSGGKIADLADGSVRDLAGGTYYVRVAGTSSSGESSYGLSFSGAVVLQDDSRENNDDTASATPISGGTTITGLRLLANDADYFTFVMNTRGEAVVNLDRSALGGVPTAELLDASQRVVANVNAGTNRFILDGGRYYLRFRSSTSYSGTYGLTLGITLANARPVMTGTFNDVAFDSAGTLHLAYYDHRAKTLKYVTRTRAGIWSAVRVIDKAVGAGQHVSLAVSAKGQVGMAYYAAGTKDLKFAYSVGGGFAVQSIETDGTTGEYASLAFNPSARPVIAYYRRTGGDLRLAEMGKSGKWNVRTLDSTDDTGRFASLAMNPATGRFAVAYLNQTRGIFMYAENAKKSNWAKKVVHDTKSGGGHVSLAFDSRNRPAFSYYEGAGQDLMFARREGSKWNVQKAATTGNVGQYSDLSFSGTTPSIYAYNKSTGSAILARSQKSRWVLSDATSAGGSRIHAAKSPFGETVITWENKGVLNVAGA